MSEWLRGEPSPNDAISEVRAERDRSAFRRKSLAVWLLLALVTSVLLGTRGSWEQRLGRFRPGDTPSAAVVQTPELPATPRLVAPDFTLKTLDGRTVSLSDFRGKAVLINFWASWCMPCRVEMPAIERAYRRYRAEGFEVLAIDIEETPETVQDFVNELGLTFTVLLDEDGTVAQQYFVRGIPTSFFLDRQGYVVASHLGAMSPAVIEEHTLRALGRPGSENGAPDE